MKGVKGDEMILRTEWKRSWG